MFVSVVLLTRFIIIITIIFCGLVASGLSLWNSDHVIYFFRLRVSRALVIKDHVNLNKVVNTISSAICCHYRTCILIKVYLTLFSTMEEFKFYHAVPIIHERMTSAYSFLIKLWMSSTFAYLTKGNSGMIFCAESIIYTTWYFLQTFDRTGSFIMIFGQIMCLCLIFNSRFLIEITALMPCLMTYCPGLDGFFNTLILKHIYMFVLRCLPNTVFIAVTTAVILFDYVSACDWKSIDDVFLAAILYGSLKCSFAKKIDIYIVFAIFCCMCVWIKCKSDQFSPITTNMEAYNIIKVTFERKH